MFPSIQADWYESQPIYGKSYVLAFSWSSFYKIKS